MKKRSDVICILGDWETVAEGIIFTEKSDANSVKRSFRRYM